MARYFLRVELHQIGSREPSGEIYNALHATLKEKNILRVIVADNGYSYQLPWGVYTAEWTDSTPRQVADYVSAVVKGVWNKATVLAIQSATWAANDLPFA